MSMTGPVRPGERHGNIELRHTHSSPVLDLCLYRGAWSYNTEIGQSDLDIPGEARRETRNIELRQTVLLLR